MRERKIEKDVISYKSLIYALEANDDQAQEKKEIQG